MKQSVFARVHCLSPMRSKLFMTAWIVNVTSSVGSQIHHAGDKYQMNHLTASPLLMALLETSTALPLMLLGFSAGMLADIVDRRKILIVTHAFMLICAAVASGLTFFKCVTPNILLTITFLLGVASALSMPAYQAILPDLVENESLIPEGTTLNSAGYNISRMLGPAAGGFICNAFGVHWAFMINALSFLGVIIALAVWQKGPSTVKRAHEPFFATMRSGFNYVRYSKSYRVTILWTMCYMWFGSIVFSLLSVLLLKDMKLSDLVSGLLFSCIGTGAVAVLFLLPLLRRRFKTNSILVGFTLLAVASQGTMSYTRSVPVIAACLTISGMSWLAVMSTATVFIQLSVPEYMKARAFGVYYTFWGAVMAFSSVFWGKLASRELLGLRFTIRCSAIGLLLSLLVLSRIKIAVFDKKLVD